MDPQDPKLARDTDTTPLLPGVLFAYNARSGHRPKSRGKEQDQGRAHPIPPSSPHPQPVALEKLDTCLFISILTIPNSN